MTHIIDMSETDLIEGEFLSLSYFLIENDRFFIFLTLYSFYIINFDTTK